MLEPEPEPPAPATKLPKLTGRETAGGDGAAAKGLAIPRRDDADAVVRAGVDVDAVVREELEVVVEEANGLAMARRDEEEAVP